MSQYLLIVSVSISLSLIAQYYVGNIWKVTFLPEAGVTILIGITVGFFLHNIHNEHLEENDDEHFNPHVLGLSSKVFVTACGNRVTNSALMRRRANLFVEGVLLRVLVAYNIQCRLPYETKALLRQFWCNFGINVHWHRHLHRHRYCWYDMTNHTLS
jgi:hypothetical protein